MTEKTHPSVGGGGEKAEPLFKKSWSEVANFVYNADTDGIPASWFDSQWPTDFGASVMDNLGVSKAADIAYHSNLSVSKDAEIFNHTNLGVDKAASIFDDANLQPVKAADILDHSNLSGGAKTGRRNDIMMNTAYLSNTKFDDIISDSVYGITAGSLSGKKGFTHQIHEEKNFHSITETPNHAYWHRIYNTPAAFETVYQDYTTKLDKQGTTPQKSAPNTADPNPQPGAMWSVSMVPDGTQIGGFSVVSGPGANTALTWDGTYLWLGSQDKSTIYKLKTDGTQVDSFAAPAGSPFGLTWDGCYLWDAEGNPAYIYQLKTDGTQTGNGFASPGPSPQGLAWDGTYLWHADSSALYIYQLNPDGTQAGGGFASPSSSPRGMGWDGTYLWNGDTNADYTYMLDTSGTQVGGFSTIDNPKGEIWTGRYLWEACDGADYIYQWGNAGNFDVNYRIFAK